MSSDLCSVETKLLRVGAKLRSAIYDNRHVLLLSEGMVITPRFRDRLLQRGIDEVMVPAGDVARLCAGIPQGNATTALAEKVIQHTDFQSEETASFDQTISAAELGLPPQASAVIKDAVDHGAAAYDESRVAATVDHRERQITQVGNIFEGMLRGAPVDLGAMQEIADSAITDFVHDKDLFANLGINPAAGEYPMRHSVQTTMLALSIGAKLGLDRTTLRELALGCLLHDAGMLMIKPIHDSDALLDPIQFLEISKHPVLVFQKLTRQEGVPQRSTFIAYQIHERCNGTGYPRGRTDSQIHFLSKIAAVADAYVGLVSPRSYRPAMLPYHALATILHRTGDGLFDKRATRSLLETISLFPLGSFIKLEDGRVAQVMRSSNKYDRPVVEAWFPPGEGPETSSQPTEMLDLSIDDAVQIAGAIAGVPARPSLPEVSIEDYE